MKNFVKLIFSEESGQGMVEYGLLIALIVIVLISAINQVGIRTNNLFEYSKNEILS